MKEKIKSFATIQMGYSFRSRLETSESGEVAVIQMKDLEEEVVNGDGLVKIDLDTIKDHHLVQKDDLVFRSRGNLTTSAILLCDPGKAVVAAPLFRIRVTSPEIVLPEYLNWYIGQREAQMFFGSRTAGSLQKMISKQALEDLDVFLPSLEQQKDIVELVSLCTREKEILKTIAKKRKDYISTKLMKIAKGENI